MRPFIDDGFDRLNGMHVTISPMCMTPSKEPAFPVSRHRSRRIHKKLERRHGAQFPMLPACLEINGRLFVHPQIWDQIKREMKAST
jgi:hypothetical protein